MIVITPLPMKPEISEETTGLWHVYNQKAQENLLLDTVLVWNSFIFSDFKQFDGIVMTAINFLWGSTMKIVKAISYLC